jgi:hypothetical protein
MTLAIEIGVGVWLGGLFLIGSVAGYIQLHERIQKARRIGGSWRNAFNW